MRINIQYVEQINYRQMFKLFKNKKINEKTEILQIGVGGFTASGKTLLIDAILSLFGGKGERPYYIPNRFNGRIHTQIFSNGKYESFENLQNLVQKKFEYSELFTEDKGIWNENMYEGTLDFCGKQVTLIFRNIPGEMFRYYYSANEGVKNISLNQHFRDFCAKENVDFKNLFKKLDEKGINDIRDKFFDEYLKKVEVSFNWTQKPKTHDNFYAYLFYRSSDSKIYCIKSSEKEETAMESDRENITYLKYEPIYCITQFDRIINKEKFLDFGISANINNKDGYNPSEGIKLWNKPLFQSSKKNIFLQGETPIENKDDIRTYFKRMNKLYNETLNNKVNVITDKDQWDHITNHFNGELSAYTCFLTSISFHKKEKIFYSFEDSNKKWIRSNFTNRTSFGVLEMMLHILGKSGFKLKNSKIPFTEEYPQIVKMINI